MLALALVVLAPAARAEGMSGADLSAQIKDETGIAFDIAPDWELDPKADHELQMTRQNVFVAMFADNKGVQGAFEQCVGMMKAIGKDSFKTTVEPKDVDQQGLKGRFTMGTLTLQGKQIEWVVVVFDGGKTPLRIAAMGDDLQNDKGFNALIDSIKKP
jgi:hypothetical protein